MSMVPVFDAIEEGAPGEVTVGVIADRLAVDPSRASRIVATAVERGYVERTAAGRRSVLELTEAGREAADIVHSYRRRLFTAAIADWKPEERDQFVVLLERFLDDLGD
ncbi:MarR family winged helix-turn-helix transcriptional regulator [Streptomyces sp. NPDC055105]|uniref:MarR family winged helix-turn-helix transcriptional regulator n=1 Tax=Streptomyces sp. NPDC055105 TaxID=3365719 RepID=UPI0037D42400